MGAVYEAYDRERNETVALKTLRWRDPAGTYRLKREFRVLSDVAHPNLVSLYELVAEGDAWFHTMELVDGRNFLEHVRSTALGPGHPPEIPRLRAALRQLVEGVVALHRAGIVHRDLKPSNVLVTRTGRVVVLDFGLAAAVAPAARLQTREEGLWGTAAYMAPEQLERVIPFPFHLLNNNHAMNVRPRNYSWPEFYDRVIDLTHHSFSWRAG